MPGQVYVGRLPLPAARGARPHVDGVARLDVTSGSRQRYRGVALSRLAPAALGPVLLQTGDGETVVQNLENLWRGTAVAVRDATEPVANWRTAPTPCLQPKLGWYERRARTWAAARTRRAAPRDYTWWETHAYDEYEARLRLFAPLYADLVRRTPAFCVIAGAVRDGVSFLVLDYDGPAEPVPAARALACKTPPGAAAVLACLLAGLEPWATHALPRTWRVTRTTVRGDRAAREEPGAEKPAKKRKV